MSELRTYTVRGPKDWEVTVRAGSPEDAAIKALQKRPPSHLGYIIEIECDGAGPFYMDSIVALKAAGLMVADD